jgi:hypothetical protein
MLRCALRWPRTIGGGSGRARPTVARPTVACTWPDGRGVLAGEDAAIAATMRKHGIAMPPPTGNLAVLPEGRILGRFHQTVVSANAWSTPRG